MSARYVLDPGTRAVLTDLGVHPATVLRRAGLPGDLLAGGPVSLPAESFFALWRALEIETDDPDLPLRIHEVASPEVFAPVVFAALMSADLCSAAERIARYKRLVSPVEVRVDVGSERTTIAFDWPAGSHPPASLVTAELLFWVGIARTGTRRRLEPVRVTAPEPPAPGGVYRAELGVDVEAGPGPAVEFTTADATRPFLTANEAIWATFEPDLRRRLADLDAEATTAERVRSALLELLPTGRTTVADVAADLAMSGRTLHRRLQAERTSFGRILDATREELACHYLRDPARSAAEIAFLLGYEETSSFYRAFQGWTGRTPEQTRASFAA